MRQDLRRGRREVTVNGGLWHIRRLCYKPVASFDSYALMIDDIVSRFFDSISTPIHSSWI